MKDANPRPCLGGPSIPFRKVAPEPSAPTSVARPVKTLGSMKRTVTEKQVETGGVMTDSPRKTAADMIACTQSPDPVQAREALVNYMLALFMQAQQNQPHGSSLNLYDVRSPRCGGGFCLGHKTAMPVRVATP